MASTEDLITFQVGVTYAVRSLGDHNCIFSFTVEARTAKFVTLASSSYNKGTKRVGVQVVDGIETAMPLGRYSLAPCLKAGSDATPDLEADLRTAHAAECEGAHDVTECADFAPADPALDEVLAGMTR